MTHVILLEVTINVTLHLLVKHCPNTEKRYQGVQESLKHIRSDVIFFLSCCYCIESTWRVNSLVSNNTKSIRLKLIFESSVIYSIQLFLQMKNKVFFE